MADLHEYRERLLPSPPAILVIVGLLVMFAVAFGAALSAAVGWATFLVGGLALGVMLVGTAPVIEVDGEVLRAGKAVLPRRCIAGVEPLDATMAREARGMNADARQFVLLRSWASAKAVRIVLDDPDDPHRSWLISSRHPDRLAAALQ